MELILVIRLPFSDDHEGFLTRPVINNAGIALQGFSEELICPYSLLCLPNPA